MPPPDVVLKPSLFPAIAYALNRPGPFVNGYLLEFINDIKSGFGPAYGLAYSVTDSSPKSPASSF